MHESGLTKRDLAEKLAVILSDVVNYKFTAHGYHWNVKGPNFPQFHKFFGKLYEDAEGSVDTFGESIRTLGYDAPQTLTDFMSMACMESRIVAGDPIQMSLELYGHNAHIRECLLVAFEMCSALNQQGIANFLADRIGVHEKFMWQLSTIAGLDSTSISDLH